MKTRGRLVEHFILLFVIVIPFTNALGDWRAVYLFNDLSLNEYGNYYQGPDFYPGKITNINSFARPTDEQDGKAYFYGGYGFSQWLYDYDKRPFLWEFDMNTLKWSCVENEETPQNDQYSRSPNYGNRSQYSSVVQPGQLDGANGWVVDNHAYLYGGSYGSYRRSTLLVYDLVDKKQWKWISGEIGGSHLPIFPNSTNMCKTRGSLEARPGAKDRYATFVDHRPDGGTDPHLYMFGGYSDGFSAMASNNLWRYSPRDDEWCFVSGDEVYGGGSYTTKGTFDPANIPGSRFWTVHSDIGHGPDMLFWIFGGVGWSQNHADLWVYGVDIGQWKWASGIKSYAGQTEATFPRYTSEFSDFALPSERGYARGVATVIQSKDYLFLFGGSGKADYYCSNIPRNWVCGGSLNDFWVYKIETNQWKFIGDILSRDHSRYGNDGEFRVTTEFNNSHVQYLGARNRFFFAGTNEHLYVFGGLGTEYYTNLYEYRIPSNEIVEYSHVCDGIAPESNKSCSGHGICVSEDVCQCAKGFDGQFCEQGMCFRSISDNDCAPGGVCLKIDTCECFPEEMYGMRCQIRNDSSQIIPARNYSAVSYSTNEYPKFAFNNDTKKLLVHQFSIENSIGARSRYCVFKKDNERTAFFWGGVGCTNSSCSSKYFNDMWELRITPTSDGFHTFEWRYTTISGPLPIIGNQKGVYPLSNDNKNKYISGIYPDSRAALQSNRFNDDEYCIFGGDGRGGGSDYADLWCFSVRRKLWKLMHGSNGTFPSAVYPELQDYCKYLPDIRPAAVAENGIGVFSDKNEILIFGGEKGSIYTGNNDMWIFSMEENLYRYMGGERGHYGRGSYGSKGNFSKDSLPSSRRSFVYWSVQKSQSGALVQDEKVDLFYVFGGYFYDGDYSIYLSDMWAVKWTDRDVFWRWVLGPQIPSYSPSFYHGVYEHEFTEHAIPGGRHGDFGQLVLHDVYTNDHIVAFYGGVGCEENIDSNNLGRISELWIFSTVTEQFRMVFGKLWEDYPGNFDPSLPATNHPRSLEASFLVPFDTNVYLFAGSYGRTSSFYTDVWVMKKDVILPSRFGIWEYIFTYGLGVIVLIVALICFLCCVCMLCYLSFCAKCTKISEKTTVVGEPVRRDVTPKTKTKSIMMSSFRKSKRDSKLDVFAIDEVEETIPMLDFTASVFQIDEKDVEITKYIGAGASGTIYQGKYMGKDVALKTFPATLFHEETEKFEEFEKEISLLLTLGNVHPNIISCFGALITKTKVGILMEFCPYGDLNTFLKNYEEENGEMYPLDLRFKFMMDISAAVSFLHSKNIIWRDCKGENILVDVTKNIKITDFGASSVVSDINKTKTSGVGTFQYMAPEIVEYTHKYDESVDVFSAAILFWEILVNFRVSPYDNTQNVHIKVLNDPTYRPKIKTLVKNCGFIGKWMTDILRNGWSAESSERPSFKEIIKILDEKWVNKKPIDVYCRTADQSDEDAVDFELKKFTNSELKDTIFSKFSKVKVVTVHIKERKGITKIDLNSINPKWLSQDDILIINYKKGQKSARAAPGNKGNGKPAGSYKSRRPSNRSGRQIVGRRSMITPPIPHGPKKKGGHKRPKSIKY